MYSGYVYEIKLYAYNIKLKKFKFAVTLNKIMARHYSKNSNSKNATNRNTLTFTKQSITTRKYNSLSSIDWSYHLPNQHQAEHELPCELFFKIHALFKVLH